MIAAVRRVARHLFTIMSAMSLLLCVAFIFMWLRSYRHEDRIGHWWTDDHSKNVRILGSRDGLVYLRSETDTFPAGMFSPVAPIGPVYLSDLQVASPSQRWFEGFEFYHETRSIEGRIRAHVPYWFLAILTLPLPALRGLSYRRYRRRCRNNLCHTCGYDLRASPERCPECGTANPRAV